MDQRPFHQLRTCAAAWLCVTMVAAGAVSAQTVSAQTAAPPADRPLTLADVLDLARARSASIAIARQGVERAGLERQRARSGLRPQLGVSASYDRAFASEFDGVFDNFNRGQEGAAFEDVPFGRENTWRASLSFSQSLYSGDRVGARTALADAGDELARVAVTTAEAQVLFTATKAYYDAILADRLLAIAEATVEQADATLQQAQAAFTAGTQPEFEVLRARVSRDTQTPLVIRRRVDRELALLRLAQMLDLPLDADVRLADSLADQTLPPPPVFAAQVAAAGDAPTLDRAVVEEAAVAIELREAALRLARAERMPSVALRSDYGRVAYPTGTFPSGGDFRTNWTAGAVVQVPLMTGGRLRAEERIAETNVTEARERLRQVNDRATLDTRSARAELVAAQAAWESTAGTIEQARRAYEIAEVRYSSGVSTQLELSDSRLLLQQAEASRVRAARDLQVARARVALLPGLPFGAEFDVNFQVAGTDARTLR